MMVRYFAAVLGLLFCAHQAFGAPWGQIIDGKVHWITATNPAVQYGPHGAVVFTPSEGHAPPSAPLNMLFADLSGHSDVREGWSFANGAFAAPPAPPDPPAPSPRKISKLDFLRMFTMQEIAAAGALKATTLFAFWAFYDAATLFERDATETTLGLAALVGTGCITQQRADAIVANWPMQ